MLRCVYSATCAGVVCSHQDLKRTFVWLCTPGWSYLSAPDPLQLSFSPFFHYLSIFFSLNCSLPSICVGICVFGCPIGSQLSHASPENMDLLLSLLLLSQGWRLNCHFSSITVIFFLSFLIFYKYLYKFRCFAFDAAFFTLSAVAVCCHYLYIFMFCHLCPAAFK